MANPFVHVELNTPDANQLLFGARKWTAVEAKLDQTRTNARCFNAVP